VPDGVSTDRSREIVGECQKRRPNGTFLDNPRGTALCGFNIGTRAMQGSPVFIFGATLHAILTTCGSASGYLRAGPVGRSLIDGGQVLVCVG
jgi:hypothetical protein